MTNNGRDIYKKALEDVEAGRFQRDKIWVLARALSETGWQIHNMKCPEYACDWCDEATDYFFEKVQELLESDPPVSSETPEIRPEDVYEGMRVVVVMPENDEDRDEDRYYNEIPPKGATGTIVKNDGDHFPGVKWDSPYEEYNGVNSDLRIGIGNGPYSYIPLRGVREIREANKHE